MGDQGPLPLIIAAEPAHQLRVVKGGVVAIGVAVGQGEGLFLRVGEVLSGGQRIKIFCLVQGRSVEEGFNVRAGETAAAPQHHRHHHMVQLCHQLPIPVKLTLLGVVPAADGAAGGEAHQLVPGVEVLKLAHDDAAEHPHGFQVGHQHLLAAPLQTVAGGGGHHQLLDQALHGDIALLVAVGFGNRVMQGFQHIHNCSSLYLT